MLLGARDQMSKPRGFIMEDLLTHEEAAGDPGLTQVFNRVRVRV